MTPDPNNPFPVCEGCGDQHPPQEQPAFPMFNPFGEQEDEAGLVFDQFARNVVDSTLEVIQSWTEPELTRFTNLMSEMVSFDRTAAYVMSDPDSTEPTGPAIMFGPGIGIMLTTITFASAATRDELEVGVEAQLSEDVSEWGEETDASRSAQSLNEYLAKKVAEVRG